jgi:hypothetical protein
MKDGQRQSNRYEAIIASIFLSRHKEGAEKVPFTRDDIVNAARQLKIGLPKNLGDLIYSFRFRSEFPDAIRRRAPQGKSWIIRLVGRGRYCFVANPVSVIVPRPEMSVTKVPDATPGMIEKYSLSDEQALLAKLRYNRLIDIFTGVACYSLQSHLRTAVPAIGQVETDEVYVGVDRKGVQYVFPVQAKGGKDKQSIVQIEQDLAMCRAKFPQLVCRPLAAQFMRDDTISLFEFEEQEEQITITAERHYKLVPPDSVTAEDLDSYRRRLAEN